MPGPVQQVGGTNTATLAGTPTNGNRVIVTIFNRLAGISSVSCGGQSLVKDKGTASGIHDAHIWSVIASGMSNGVVTITGSGRTNNITSNASEWAIANAATVDVSSSHSFGSSTTPTTDSITPSASSLIVAALGFVLQNYSSGPTNSFTRMTNATALESAYRQAVTDAISTGVTLDSTDTWDTVAVAYLESAVAYSLTSTVGAFTESGQAAGLKVGRVVAGAVGSYSLSGQPAGLKIAHKLTAAAGLFTESGQSSSLIATRRSSMSAASFVITAQASGLRVDRRLTSSVAIDTLTGNSAGLTATRVLPIASGSFILTGQNASFVATRILPALSAAFVLAGQAASLLDGKRLAASAASFTASGLGVGLRSTRILSPAQTSFVMTGRAVGLLVGRAIAAAKATYVFTGKEVTLSSTATTNESRGRFTPYHRSTRFTSERRSTLFSPEVLDG